MCKKKRREHNKDNVQFIYIFQRSTQQKGV